MKILHSIDLVKYIDMPIEIQEIIEPWKFEAFGIHNDTYFKWELDFIKEDSNIFEILGKENIEKVNNYLKKIGVTKKGVLIHYWW